MLRYRNHNNRMAQVAIKKLARSNIKILGLTNDWPTPSGDVKRKGNPKSKAQPSKPHMGLPAVMSCATPKATTATMKIITCARIDCALAEVFIT